MPLPYLCGGTSCPGTATARTPSGQRNVFRFGVERTVWELCITGSNPQQPRVIAASHFPQRLVNLVITFLPWLSSPTVIPSSTFQPIPVLDHSCDGFVAEAPARPPARFSKPRGAGRGAPKCSTGSHHKREMIPCGFSGGPVTLS